MQAAEQINAPGLAHRTGRLIAPVLLCLGASVTLAAAATGENAADAMEIEAVDGLHGNFLRPDAIPSPEGNPMTAERIELGKMLFFDPRLSGSGAISCATCHNPSLGWQDGMARGIGDKGHQLGRHTPTILNIAWSEPLFWDGRAENLEEQALGPMMADAEMAGDPAAILRVLNGVAFYRDSLQRLFPDGGATIENAASLIAAFQRTIVSGEAPFDRWISGDEQAISLSAQRGFTLFNTKANCAACHSGWRFADDSFYDIGLAGDDLGRGALMPGITVLEHAFKTPTLRNIAERAPYMHDGSVATLEGVVDHYDHGFIRRESLSSEVQELNLTDDEKADLVEFMRSLSSVDDPVTFPVLPR